MLDTVSQTKLDSVAEIDLSRDEDSVQSLASLSTENGLFTFAGINASRADQKAGKNDHCRYLSISFPRKTGDEGKTISGVGKGKILMHGAVSLFKRPSTETSETYQRIVRVAPVEQSEKSSQAVGVLATGLAPESEIVLFDAKPQALARSAVIQRIDLSKGDEANDLDIISVGDDIFALAYVTDRAAYTTTLRYDFTRKKLTESPLPRAILKVTETGQASGTQPKLRFVRYLTTHHVVLLQNLPGGKGVELTILYIHPTSSRTKVLQVARKALPKTFKQGVALEICRLDADAVTGERQIVIAVASKDTSIHLFTVNHYPSRSKGSRQLSSIANAGVLHTVHPHENLTKLAFSHFKTPAQTDDSTSSTVETTQYIQLASTTLEGNVIVDTFALTSIPTSPYQAHKVTGKSAVKVPALRFVLATPSAESMVGWTGGLITSLSILLLAFMLSSYLGTAPPLPGVGEAPASSVSSVISSAVSKVDSALGQISDVVQDAERLIPTGPSLDDVKEAVEMAEQQAATDEVIVSTVMLKDFVSSASMSAVSITSEATSAASSSESSAAEQPGMQHILIRPASNTDGSDQDDAIDSASSFSISSHDSDTLHTLKGEHGAVHFEDLHPKEQAKWKRRLAAAGHWVEAEGDAILKGILFSEYAGVVGGALRDAVLAN